MPNFGIVDCWRRTIASESHCYNHYSFPCRKRQRIVSACVLGHRQNRRLDRLVRAVWPILVGAGLGLPVLGFGDSSAVCLAQDAQTQDVLRLPPPVSPATDLGVARAPVRDAGPGDSTPKEQAAEKEEPEKKPNGEETDESGKEKKDDEKEFKVERFNAYGQATVISEWNGPFHSPYIGPHSFLPIHEWATSDTATLYLGARCWQGAELYFNPEVAGGLGLSDVYGIAGFPNGDVTRVGDPAATPYVARLYLAQTVGFGGEQEKIESGPNQLASYKDISRFTFAVGKMAAEDWFDQNAYSHDPRVGFMNWSLMYNGAWDYPADVRGYTYGMVAELNQKAWALRYGIFAEPSVANGPDIDSHFNLAHGQAVELEYRYQFLGRPGKARGMFYWNRANMGNYRRVAGAAASRSDHPRNRFLQPHQVRFLRQLRAGTHRQPGLVPAVGLERRTDGKLGLYRNRQNRVIWPAVERRAAGVGRKIKSAWGWRSTGFRMRTPTTWPRAVWGSFSAMAN